MMEKFFYKILFHSNLFFFLDFNNKAIPKTGTVFVFEHQDKVYKLNGYNIKMSSFNRSKAKPKLNLISNL